MDKYKTSVEDLRQMFTYGHYFDARDTALIYPGFVGQYQGLFTIQMVRFRIRFVTYYLLKLKNA
ncbi:MAG: hypothetical protein IPO65_13065 [Saprospiraceae bacterium]|nr:hypothetical protein [Saprospiraceae bacterium]